MIYTYDCKCYDDFKQLLNTDKTTAKMLLDELDLNMDDLDDCDWAHDYLTVYPTTEDYAIYELTDGWYMEHNFNSDFRGAPSPMDWIDLDEFGQRLADTGDSNVCLLLPNGKVVTTSYGW